MRAYEILEARKNPEQNPKTSAWDWFDKYYAQHGDNLFVSFTAIDKLGLNPGSKYNTPLGIYAYQAKYVDQVGNFSELPFAGDQRYVNFFIKKNSANVLELSEMSDSERIELSKRLIDGATKYYKIAPDSVQYQEWHTKWKNGMRYAETHARDPDTPGSVFWYSTKLLAEYIARVSDRAHSPHMWNHILRSAGIDGFTDNGYSIIHPSEPTQAVFFTLNTVQLLDRVPNTDYRAIEARQRAGAAVKEKIAQLAAMTPDQLYAHISEHPADIKHIKQPDERLQMLAIDNAQAGHIRNPSPKMQAYMLARAPTNILHIKHPTSEQIIQAITRLPHLIRELPPTQLPPKLELAVIKRDDGLFKDIYNPSEQACLAIAKRQPMFIAYITNPSIKVQMTAVRSDPFIAAYTRLAPEVQIFVYQNMPELLHSILAPSPELLAYARQHAED
jgi:hypothetical protein